MKPVSLDARRIERAGSCEWCGQPAHAVPLLCPRVTAVQYGFDEVVVFFQTAPVIIAIKDLPRYAAEEA